MRHPVHTYRATLAWRGNSGDGTRRYDGYARMFDVAIDGKPTLRGSADAAFRGDASLHNPEDLLLAAIASCHMLSYLALCARHRICVLDYVDHAVASMQLDIDGGGRFTEVVLHPVVLVEDDSRQALPKELHAVAHRLCFVANSCNFPIRNEPVLRIARAGGSVADAQSGPINGNVR